MASAPLVDVDSFESFNVSTRAGVLRTWHSRYCDLCVPAGCRSFCVGWLNLNKLDGWHQGGGGWSNDGTKVAWRRLTTNYLPDPS